MTREDLIARRNQIWRIGGISVAVLLLLAFAAGYVAFRGKSQRAAPQDTPETPAKPH